MPPIEQRLKDIEDRIAQLDLQQLRFPLDYTSQKIIRSLENKRVDLLKPLETAAASEGTHTLLNNTACIQFADAATGEAYFILPVPQNIKISRLEFIWSTPATSGNLRWQINIGAGSDSEATNARTTGGTAVTTAADGTANDLKFTDILSANTGTNFNSLFSSQRGIWGIKFTRTGADAGDTLSNTVNLYGLLIEYEFI